MIAAEEFTFQYPTGDEPAIEDLTFEVEEGEVLGVLGPVEAGKTSLAMALAGFVPDVTKGWTTGDLEVAGRDPREFNDDKVAMVFEDYSSQLTQINVVDEVIAPLTNRGVSREEAREEAEELLDTVRLDEDPRKFTWELSGGQQQRLAIAAALAIDPEVLIFDTATDMLDPQGRRNVADLIASLAGETTLVVTENDPDHLVGIADRVLVLDDGERVTAGPADEILRDADLLDEVGVGPPLALDVARRIGLDASPVTVGEFTDEFVERFDIDRIAAEAPPGLTPSENDVGDVVVDAEDVTYEYPDGTVAVEDVSLSVRGGEVHAILGGNGAGKTTMTKLLVGLQKPSSGRVTVAGTDTRESTARELAESIGIALQNPDEQLSEQTVREEVRYPLERRRYDRRLFGLLGKRERYEESHIQERVETVCDMVGLDEDRRELDPIFLPRGARRLVTMASALALDPGAVVLDEPIAGVDRTTREHVKSTIESLRAEGMAVVLVDHDMDFVCEVADTATVLDGGTVARQGPVETVFGYDNWEWLAERYLSPPRAARLARQVGVESLTADRLEGVLAPLLEAQA